MVSGIVLPPHRIVNENTRLQNFLGQREAQESTHLETWALAIHEDPQQPTHAVKRHDRCLSQSMYETKAICLTPTRQDAWHRLLPNTTWSLGQSRGSGFYYAPTCMSRIIRMPSAQGG
jgi:hypothetical protein